LTYKNTTKHTASKTTATESYRHRL